MTLMVTWEFPIFSEPHITITSFDQRRLGTGVPSTPRVPFIFFRKKIGAIPPEVPSGNLT